MTLPESVNLPLLERLRSDAVTFPLEDQSMFRLTGEDAASWLQGQATQDLRGLAAGESRPFCLCNATGQIEAIARAYQDPEGLLVTLDASSAPTFADRLERMVIIEDVVGQPWTGRGFSVQGPTATDWISRHLVHSGLDAVSISVGGAAAWLLRRDRTGSGGWDLWTAGPDPEWWTELPVLGPTESRFAALESGIPKYWVDTDRKTLPPELGRAFETDHVSYVKGCYLGQEVLQRIHSRGHTNRTWVAVVIDGLVVPRASVYGPDQRVVGSITQAFQHPELGTVAGAMVRNDTIDSGGPISVDSPAGRVAGEIRALPIRNLFQD